MYREDKNEGDDLYNDFILDFENFQDALDFVRAGIEAVRRLRNVLQKRGMYIPKETQRGLIPRNLAELVKTTEPPKWDQTDSDYADVEHLF